MSFNDSCFICCFENMIKCNYKCYLFLMLCNVFKKQFIFKIIIVVLIENKLFIDFFLEGRGGVDVIFFYVYDYK